MSIDVLTFNPKLIRRNKVSKQTGMLEATGCV